MTRHPFFVGVSCALGAGLAWGLVFIAPVILHDYPAAMLACARHVAFGLICLPLAWRYGSRIAMMDRQAWLRAFELAAIGNIAYNLCLAASIQLIDTPLPAVIIGTLPVVIAVCSNFHEATLPWRRLLPSLLVIAAGIVLVQLHEQQSGSLPEGNLLSGVLLAIGAVVCWTWYPLRNSAWLRARPQLGSGTWATAQGVATLPLALVGFVLAAWWYDGPAFDAPLGPRPELFVGLMLAIGLLASWLGTLLWNRASQLLPTALVGQLIVFETLAAMAYAFLWRGELPGWLALAGAALLVAGVVAGVRAFQRG
ncbi:DMT family transporter [Uliginosibacterium sp. H1]|uniref:DMT family transporter n=1 Tax=Uliginosibacterium sp. H1 TaxID=3114757 RepID=UPI002E16D4A9|nr:DMT family transporter [Uliginosibacterium sp. H1]